MGWEWEEDGGGGARRPIWIPGPAVAVALRDLSDVGDTMADEAARVTAPVPKLVGTTRQVAAGPDNGIRSTDSPVVGTLGA